MTFQQKVTPWLLNSPQATDKIRLFCFPYAGGGASIYRGWDQLFPVDAGIYPIQFPGRENRITEPLIVRMHELVYEISEMMMPYLDIPFIFFGHSLGARVAFELTRTIRRKYNVMPCHLIVAGSRAPDIPEPNPLHQLSDEDFVKELRRFSGTPEMILQNKEIMDIFIPILRADFTVDETYVFTEDEPLECPITVYGGTEDKEANPKELTAWKRHTTKDFMLEMLEGNHFFFAFTKKCSHPIYCAHPFQI